MKDAKNKFYAILFISATLLLVANIALIFQNLNFRAQLSGLKPLQVEEKDAFEDFQAWDTNKNETAISFSDTNKTILLFFNTKCGFCEKQMPFWKELALVADNRGYQLVAVTTETDTTAINNYQQNHGIENWKVLTISRKQAQKAKLTGTPVTVVVDNNGVVERAWTGFWQPGDVDSASKYFATNFHTSP